MTFNAPYLFKKNNEVIIKGPHGGTLRANPHNEHTPDGNGGTGEFARWHVELHEEGIRLKNLKNHKYLRVYEHGKHIDIKGHERDEDTIFKVHHGREAGVASLENFRYRGQFVTVHSSGEVAVGREGPNTILHFLREGDAHGRSEEHHDTETSHIGSSENNRSGFTVPYLFHVDRSVVVQTPNGKFLRVSPGNTEHVDANGATGPFARWKVELKDLGQFMLKSENTGHYLRIFENQVDCKGEGGKWCLFRYHQLSDNVVKLEAVHSHRQYIHADSDGHVEAGTGSSNSELRFWHEGGVVGHLPREAAEVGFHQVTQQVTKAEESKEEPVQRITEQVIKPPITEQVTKPSQESTKVEEKKEQARTPEASAVAKWLEQLGFGQYTDTFLRNGFDRLSAVYKIEEKDLTTMGVALGHIKVILAASQNARYIDKTVVIRSSYGYFLSAHKPSGKEGKFDHHDKRDGASFFIVKDVGNNKIALECKGFNTYMHIPTPDSGNHVRHGPMDKTAELQFVSVEKPGHIAIKCVTNGAYLVLAEKKLFGRSIVTSYDLGKDCAVELTILEN